MNTCPMCSEQEGATAERDALREQVARLGASEMYWEGFAKRLIRERRDLRAALEKYGRHYGGCTGHRCYCGLSEALNPGDPEPAAAPPRAPEGEVG